MWVAGKLQFYLTLSWKHKEGVIIIIITQLLFIAYITNLCYSDLPSIFSGQCIGFLDPHELYFEYDGRRTSSYVWDLVSEKEQIASLTDQFSPYLQELFGATQQVITDGFFNGTIFRFPFRTEQSELCKTIYDSQKALSLFESLKADAHMILLFLKSVEKIEVYEKLGINRAPRRIMSLEIAAELRQDVSCKRHEFVRMIEKQTSGERLEPASITYMMCTEFLKSETTECPDRKSWVVSHHCVGKYDASSARGIDDSMRLLPWVAVAVPVLHYSDPPVHLSSPDGHVFCFLPLPREDTASPTGFRFHAHGNFAVDQNRRHIKKRTAEQLRTSVTDTSLLWNEFLISELLPKALINALTYVTSLTDSPAISADITIYSSIPEMKHVKQEWQPFAKSFFERLPQLALFDSPATGGRYMMAKEAFFDSLDDDKSITLIIRRILHKNETRLATIPDFLLEQLGQLAKQVTPSLVCMALKNVESTLTLGGHDRMELLKYVTDESSASEQFAVTMKHKDIVGTRLLPLGDNTWTVFERPSAGKLVYVDSKDHPRTLLPTLDHFFVSEEALVMCRSLLDMGKHCFVELHR